MNTCRVLLLLLRLQVPMTTTPRGVTRLVKKLPGTTNTNTNSDSHLTPHDVSLRVNNFRQATIPHEPSPILLPSTRMSPPPKGVMLQSWMRIATVHEMLHAWPNAPSPVRLFQHGCFLPLCGP